MAEIRINATGGVKLYDADDSHYAQIVAGTITSNVDAITLGHDTVTIADNLSLGSDSAVLKFGADGDTTLTHTDGTGLTLNSTNKLCFNDASQYIQGASNAILDIAATDEIELNATLIDINANVEISGTATTTGVHTFSATPVFPNGSLDLLDLDIDGGTEIGAAIVDADLFIVDDGAGGTNRKCLASRLKTYAGGANTPAFLATTSDDQASLAAGSNTKIEYKDEIFDTNSVYDNSTNYRWTPGVEGKYAVGCTGFGSNNDGERSAVRIYKNGSSVLYSQRGNMNANGDQITVSGVLELDSDDYIEGFWFNGSSQSKSLSGGTTICRFWGYKIIT